MRIVLATPLYPPEVAGTALYTKELARRLSAKHEVTVVAYTHLPEQVPNVRVISVDKRRPLPFRLLSYTRALIRTLREADVLFVINGTSVELPVALVQSTTHKSVVLCIADALAHAYVQKSLIRRSIERFVSQRAAHVVTAIPPAQPEILPFEPRPIEALAAYEALWTSHLEQLARLFSL